MQYCNINIINYFLVWVEAKGMSGIIFNVSAKPSQPRIEHDSCTVTINIVQYPKGFFNIFPHVCMRPRKSKKYMQLLLSSLKQRKVSREKHKNLRCPDLSVHRAVVARVPIAPASLISRATSQMKADVQCTLHIQNGQTQAGRVMLNYN